MPDLNIKADDKDGVISGSGSIEFTLPADGKFNVSADADNKTTTITMSATQAIKLADQGFEFGGSIADDLRNGSLTGDVSVTYKPSDDASIHVDHTFDAEGGTTSVNVSITF